MSDEPAFADQVRRAAAGDPTAVDALVVAFSPLARATAARLVDDPFLVDDVVQEAMVEVAQAIGRLREPLAFPAWVRLAARKHADRIRRSARPADPIDAEPAAVADLDQRDRRHDVRAALGTLRADDRHLLELRYLADWSVADLAAALALTEGAVRKRLHDARRRARPAFRSIHEQEHDMTDLERHLGRIHRPGELALPPPPPIARPERREPIPTGLKILDTLAPVARGGTAELVGPVGTGHLVLAIELSYRVGRSERETAIVGVASAPLLTRLVTDVDERDRHVVIDSTDDPAGARRALDDGASLAAGLAATGVEVLLVVDRETATATGGAAALKNHAGVSSGGGSVTLLLVDAYERGGSLPPDAGLDTRLVLSLEQVALGIYPALDPIESRAHFHRDALADDVRRVLHASTALRRAFAQPMYAAADFTGVEATWVDPEEAAEELRRLVAAVG